MARRKSKQNHGSYRLLVGEVDFRVPAEWWRRYVADRWLVPIGRRMARIAHGVSLRASSDGYVLERSTREARPLTVSIPSSWRYVERAARYSLRGGSLSPEALQREIQAQYGVMGLNS